MDPKVLCQALASLPGVKAAGQAYQVADGHHVTFYIGQPGQAMVVGDVGQCSVHDSYAELRTRESSTTLCVSLDAVHAVAHRPPDQPAARRPGFG